MKKLLILVLLMVSLQSFSQDTYKSFGFISAVYDMENKGWKWSDLDSCEVKLQFDKNIVTVFSKLQAQFLLDKVLSDQDDDYVHRTQFSATDEARTRCTVNLTVSKKKRIASIVFVYATMQYGYYFKN